MTCKQDATHLEMNDFKFTFKTELSLVLFTYVPSLPTPSNACMHAHTLVNVILEIYKI